MKPIPTVKSVMTLFPHRVEVDQDVAEAARFMAERGIRHLPVLRDSKLVGVVTDDDLRVAAAASGESPVIVESVCRTDPYVVDVRDRLDDVLDTMADRQTRCALVTRDDALIGILTTTDVCRMLARRLRETVPPDDEIA